jgi:hypothetical protein
MQVAWKDIAAIHDERSYCVELERHPRLTKVNRWLEGGVGCVLIDPTLPNIF